MFDSCMYCSQNDQLDQLMIKIAKLRISTLYFFRDQTHPGRCVLAINRHVQKLTDLSDDECATLFSEVQLSAQILSELYQPDKINYLILGDTSPHLHVHIVPKYEGKAAWGRVFEMIPSEKTVLTSEEYSNQIQKIRSSIETKLNYLDLC